MVLKISQNSQENTCVRALSNFIEKETLPQVFSCEFCEIFENTYFIEHILTTASEWFELNCALRLREAIRSFRNRRSEVFCKKSVLKNLTKFTGKHLCETLTQVFSVNFATYLRTSYFI